jgi:aspartyl-tRNA(Asn)/glutamyl-tRNA(Gln) amidotransferase subunit C
MLDEAQVLHVARLARLHLEPDEVRRMAGELSAVLTHVETIQELSLDGVAPTSHVVEVTGALRADDPEPCLPVDVALRFAPDPVQGGFGVPSPGASPA